MSTKSNLDLVNECDSFPYSYPSLSDYVAKINSYFHFQVSSHPGITLGYVLPSVAAKFEQMSDWAMDSSSTPRTLTLVSGKDEPSRSSAIAKTTSRMRESKQFRVLDKWRSELYPIYGPGNELLFAMERSATPLFGVVSYGVHMTAYHRLPQQQQQQQQQQDGQYRIWVPRRSRTKQTYPSMLDNSVAGGLAVGEKPLDCLIRESDEEASLPAQVVADGARAVGCVTYFYVREERAGGESDLLQPECQFVYDLDLTGCDVELKPNDGEVENFELMSVAQIRKALSHGEFKPNCAMVMLDFLIRHAFLAKETESDYIEIVSRLHRRLDLPVMG